LFHAKMKHHRAAGGRAMHETYINTPSLRTCHEFSAAPTCDDDGVDVAPAAARDRFNLIDDTDDAEEDGIFLMRSDLSLAPVLLILSLLFCVLPILPRRFGPSLELVVQFPPMLHCGPSEEECCCCCSRPRSSPS
jgi:hypothetical protein